jgi:hypothetical protein
MRTDGHTERRADKHDEAKGALRNLRTNLKGTVNKPTINYYGNY